MSDTFPSLPVYQPDAVREKRLVPPANRPTLTADKPIRWRVARTKPATKTKHYPRKRKIRNTDRRSVRFY